jgi:4-amino-4-deoxy-L-arabinose transferase-like glycosyltransferase
VPSPGQLAPEDARAWAFWRGALLAVMAVPAALYVVYAVRFFDYPLVDRGWTIDHLVHNAWQLVQGLPLYTDPRLGSPTAFMYTPGFTLLTAPLVALFGPELWTARLVNLAGAALLVALVVRESARRVRDKRLAWFAAGLVFLLGVTNGHQLLVAHPETWALTWTVLALLAARRAVETGRGLILAVLATCAAVATKQTTLVYALAVALPLLAAGRRGRAAAYLAGIGGLLAAATAWAQHATEGRFLDYMLLANRQHMILDRPLKTLLYLAYYLGPCVVVCAAALALTRPRLRLVERLRDPFVVALAVAVPGTAVVMIKGGSASNNLLTLTLLLVPFVVQSVEALLPWLARRPVRAGAAATLGLAVAVARVGLDAPTLWQTIAGHDQALAAARRLDEIVRSARRPVWVPLDIALALHNGLPVVSPAAILGEYRFDPAIFQPLVSQIESGAFGTIVLQDTVFSMLPESVFGPPLRRSYHPVDLVVSGAPIGIYGSAIVLERKD